MKCEICGSEEYVEELKPNGEAARICLTCTHKVITQKGKVPDIPTEHECNKPATNTSIITERTKGITLPVKIKEFEYLKLHESFTMSNTSGVKETEMEQEFTNIYNELQSQKVSILRSLGKGANK